MWYICISCHEEALGRFGRSGKARRSDVSPGWVAAAGLGRAGAPNNQPPLQYLDTTDSLDPLPARLTLEQPPPQAPLCRRW